MKRYDPAHAPDPAAWLELDESERARLVEQYHRHAGERLPNVAIHATIHAVVETQIAGGEPPAVRLAMARLEVEGLDRHEAIHAVGSVLIGHLHALMHGKAPAGDPNAAYAADLERLGAENWRRGE